MVKRDPVLFGNKPRTQCTYGYFKGNPEKVGPYWTDISKQHLPKVVCSSSWLRLGEIIGMKGLPRVSKVAARDK